MQLSTIFITLAFTLIACSCSHNSERNKAPHWGYSGATGPEHWGDLSESYILAKTGKQQSPIDISSGKASKEVVAFLYKPTACEMVNNGHAIQQDYDDGSVLKMRGNTYTLKQFHIHSPSEHTIKGKRFDMEFHLVHQSEAGEIAVVSVLLNKGKENAFLKQFWGKLPAKPEEHVTYPNLSINIGDILPRDKSCYAYDGSFTTPPCTEGVKWLILKTSVTLSADQLNTFEEIYKGNFRPVQPLNGRIIETIK